MVNEWPMLHSQRERRAIARWLGALAALLTAASAIAQGAAQASVPERGSVALAAVKSNGLSAEEATRALDFDLQRELRQAQATQAAMAARAAAYASPVNGSATPVPVPAVAALRSVASSNRNCWHEAGAKYQISPWLLYAIAQAESDLKPNAVNRSHYERTHTIDIGLMQINSSHLRPNGPLAVNGIGERELADPCVNIHVGAWLLAENIRKMGPRWDAVGAYNAVCSQLKGAACTAARKKYIDRVWTKLTRSAPTPATTVASSNAPAPRKVADEPRELHIGGRT